MLSDWNCLSDETQLLLSRQALQHALANLAHQAEILAEQIETGVLADRGGPDALRLLAALARVMDDCAPLEATPIAAMPRA
jgi:hypothetical protein